MSGYLSVSTLLTLDSRNLLPDAAAEDPSSPEAEDKNAPASSRFISHTQGSKNIVVCRTKQRRIIDVNFRRCIGAEVSSANTSRCLLLKPPPQPPSLNMADNTLNETTKGKTDSRCFGERGQILTGRCEAIER